MAQVDPAEGERIFGGPDLDPGRIEGHDGDLAFGQAPGHQGRAVGLAVQDPQPPAALGTRQVGRVRNQAVRDVEVGGVALDEDDRRSARILGDQDGPVEPGVAHPAPDAREPHAGAGDHGLGLGAGELPPLEATAEIAGEAHGIRRRRDVGRQHAFRVDLQGDARQGGDLARHRPLRHDLEVERLAGLLPPAHAHAAAVEDAGETAGAHPRGVRDDVAMQAREHGAAGVPGHRRVVDVEPQHPPVAGDRPPQRQGRHRLRGAAVVVRDLDAGVGDRQQVGAQARQLRTAAGFRRRVVRRTERVVHLETARDDPAQAHRRAQNLGGLEVQLERVRRDQAQVAAGAAERQRHVVQVDADARPHVVGAHLQLAPLPGQQEPVEHPRRRGRQEPWVGGHQRDRRQDQDPDDDRVPVKVRMPHVAWCLRQNVCPSEKCTRQGSSTTVFSSDWYRARLSGQPMSTRTGPNGVSRRRPVPRL